MQNQLRRYTSCNGVYFSGRGFPERRFFSTLICGRRSASPRLTGLEALKELEIESSLVISDAAKIVIESETDYTVEDVINIADTYYDFNDLTASINSGSW